MDSGPKNPNNKFVESGRKSQSEFRENILEDSIKRKELHMYKHKKYLRSCPSSMIESIVLSLFTVVFSSTFCPLFSFFGLFFISLSFYPFSCYILRFLHQFLHPSVSQVFRVSLSPFAPSLEPSTLSCKSAGSLLRHQLHINAAREVARQHLMRR